MHKRSLANANYFGNIIALQYITEKGGTCPAVLNKVTNITMTRLTFRLLLPGLLISAFASFTFAQQQVQRTPYDITNYRIDAQLNPDSNQITSIADVTFAPLKDTRSIAFELNGSLKVESVTLLAGVTPIAAPTTPVKPKTVKTPVPQLPQATFVQDQVGVSDIGPNVKVDLGDNVTAGTPVTLRFKYSGVMVTPEGGPLLNKRLAYIGNTNGYLFYAARWFPFHDYAADRATSDITLSVAGGFQVVGFSDVPVTPTAGKYRFVQSKPGLIGNFAYGKFIEKKLRFNDQEIQFYTRPGSESLIPQYGETIGRAMDFYGKKYGAPDCGNRLIVVQTDDETLDFYSGAGMMFIASRYFDQSRTITDERIQREAAYQWWGQTVGLKSFDDAWISQGLAEWSAQELRESQLSGPKLEAMRRESLEKALTFEQTASLARTPSTLDDQSTAYQYIMYGKGSMVFRLLKETLGKAKFDAFLRNYLQQYRGKAASIDDFEKLATQAKGDNMRYFFARWIEGTGVPEFKLDYQIIRTKAGKFLARGTVKQNYDNLRLPLELQLRAEGDAEIKPIRVEIDDTSADFTIESNGKPLEVVIDPGFALLRISEELKISAIARRGIEQFKEGNFAEAQQQFEAALKLDRSNSWIYYHLGLLFLEQRNYDLAIDNFKAASLGNLKPSWIEVWANIKMGNAYDAKGDRNRAVAAYKRAQITDDNYDNAQDIVKKYLANPFDPKDKGQNTASVK